MIENKRNFIAIGGCHISGYGLDGKPSFVDLIEEDLNSKCIYKQSYFQLKNIEKLSLILSENKTELVILQLGNYEFIPSLDLKYYKKRNKADDSFNKSSVDQTKIESFYNDRNWVVQSIINFVKILVIPLYWLVIKRRNQIHLDRLKSIIIENPTIRFILLTPFPCYKSTNNIIRRKASELFFKNSEIDNLTIVNSFKTIPANKEMFVNQAHLSQKGHRVLGKTIAKLILENESLVS